MYRPHANRDRCTIPQAASRPWPAAYGISTQEREFHWAKGANLGLTEGTFGCAATQPIRCLGRCDVYELLVSIGT